MVSNSIQIHGKYLYIRCNYAFKLTFTDGKEIDYPLGYYCFLIDEIQKYSSNNVVNFSCQNDDAVFSGYCSDVLTMSVTNLSEEIIPKIDELLDNSFQENGRITNILRNIELKNNRQQDLLISIQNTLSTFLNNYVFKEEVVDFGFMTAQISDDLICNMFIAKADAYSFNASIEFVKAFSVSETLSRSGIHQFPDFSSKLFDFSFVHNSDNSITVVANTKSLIIPFNLYDNTNSLQSGYSILNASCSISLSGFPSDDLILYLTTSAISTNHQVYKITGIDNTKDIICSFSNDSFVLEQTSFYSKAVERKTAYIGSNSVNTAINFNERLVINFDVIKVSE